MTQFGLAAQRLSTRIRQKLGWAATLEDVSVEVVVVSPEEKGRCPPAFALPGQLDRVRRVQSETTQAFEMRRVTGGEVRHAATLAYHLRDVHYADGYIYTRGARLSQVVRSEPLFLHKPEEVLEECALPGSTVGDMYFGHFVVDDSATILLAAEFGPPRLPTGTARDGWGHAAPYHTLLGFEIPLITSAVIRKAWVFQDFGMTADRRRRLVELRKRVRAKGGVRKGHGVFIQRTKGGQPRSLVNEAELASRLRQEGFEVVDPTKDSVADIVSCIHDAAIVCSVEGSALSHGLLAMASDGAIITIQPPYRFNNLWKDFTDTLGMRYGYVIGTGSEAAFRVEPDDLLRTIDLSLN